MNPWPGREGFSAQPREFPLRMPLDQEIATPISAACISPDCPPLTAIQQHNATARCAVEAQKAQVARSTATTQPRSRSHRDYARWRARQIAYGRWEPWADAAAVRDHVRRLRATGASYHTIARAAGVSPMTVYRLQNGEPSSGEGLRERIRALQATRLLAVTPASLERSAARRDASGARRRLQALIAMGHPAANLARCLDMSPGKVWDIVRVTTATVTPATHAAVCGLYERMWDLRPPERTATERRAAAAARTRAAANGWPTPMGLDDDHLDEPAYRPRSHWRPATGSGVMPQPELRPSQRSAAVAAPAQPGQARDRHAAPGQAYGEVQAGGAAGRLVTDIRLLSPGGHKARNLSTAACVTGDGGPGWLACSPYSTGSGGPT